MTVLRRQLVSDKETKRVFHPLPTKAICFLSDCFVPNVYDLGPILSSVKYMYRKVGNNLGEKVFFG